MEAILILLKILLGFVSLVFFRAIIKVKSNFDFWTWIKYDFERMFLGFVLSVFIWVVLLVEPEALKFLSAFGLTLDAKSAVLIGFAIGGFSLWKSANRFNKG